MSSPDTEAPEAEEAPPVDEVRDGIAERFRSEFGGDVVDTHVRPGDDVWVRVSRDAWPHAAEYAKAALTCVFFDFLSAIDWLPSPFGRDMDSQEDLAVHGREDREPQPPVQGYAGGETRFQVLARVASPTRHLGVTLKADLPDDDLGVGTWTRSFQGAHWHERETWEMYGIDFVGHPNLVHLYLPGDFEGFPLRKDFPLLARRVKPWPGIVDVEPLPGEDGDGEGGDGDAGGEG